MQTTKKYHITGHIIEISDPQKTRGVGGLRVNLFPINEAADQPLFKKDAVTSREGRFDIEFSESDLKDRYGNRRLDFFFKVWDKEKRLIQRTDDLLIWKLDSGAKDVVIEVKLAVDGAGNDGVNGAEKKEFMVSGLVLHASGALVTCAIVSAFDRDLRHEQPLGQAPVGNDGRYGIRYLADQFHNAEKRSVRKALTTAFNQNSSTLQIGIVRLPSVISRANGVRP